MGYATSGSRFYQSWTPTFQGFSVDPTTVECRYTVNGTMCTVQATIASGVSNANNFTLTLPFAAKTGFRARVMALGVDNGTSQNSWVSTRSGSNILDCFRTAATTTWTTSGSKGINFVLTFEIDS